GALRFGFIELALQALDFAVFGAAALERIIQLVDALVIGARFVFELFDARALALDFFAILGRVARFRGARRRRRSQRGHTARHERRRARRRHRWWRRRRRRRE